MEIKENFTKLYPNESLYMLKCTNGVIGSSQ